MKAHCILYYCNSPVFLLSYKYFINNYFLNYVVLCEIVFIYSRLQKAEAFHGMSIIFCYFRTWKISYYRHFYFPITVTLIFF